MHTNSSPSLVKRLFSSSDSNPFSNHGPPREANDQGAVGKKAPGKEANGGAANGRGVDPGDEKMRRWRLKAAVVALGAAVFTTAGYVS